MHHTTGRSTVAALSVLVALAMGAGRGISAQSPSPAVEERTAAAHPMHYYVSVPEGWTRDRRWPVALVIPDAYREFEKTARLFSAARGSQPFIVVVPLVLSGGGTARQHVGDFDYTPAVWALADSVGNCRFDDDGVTAVLHDVRERYGAEDRVFVTGWEAGGHVVTAQFLEHPERIAAVAMATPNFQGRCVTSSRTVPPSAAAIPVRGFHGAADPAWAPGQPLYAQWPRVDSVARARGFTNIGDTLIPGQGHGPMATDVLKFFTDVLRTRQPPGAPHPSSLVMRRRSFLHVRAPIHRGRSRGHLRARDAHGPQE